MGEGSTSKWGPLYRWRRELCDPESGATAMERFVGMVLSLDMNPDGFAKGGAERLASRCLIHASTVKTALAGLVTAERLRVVEQGGLKGEVKRANTYCAVIPNPSSSTTGSPGQRVAQEPRRRVAQADSKRSSSPSRARDADPTEATARAAALLRDRNHLRSIGQECQKCHGSYWLDDTDPPTRCPECAA